MTQRVARSTGRLDPLTNSLLHDDFSLTLLRRIFAFMEFVESQSSTKRTSFWRMQAEEWGEIRWGGRASKRERAVLSPMSRSS